MKRTHLILLMLAILIVAGGLSYYLYSTGKNSILDKEKESVAALIRQTASKTIQPSDFKADAPRGSFEEFWKHLQTIDIVRLKVWDTDYRITWSNLPEIIGQRYDDNEELSEAYEGNVELEFAEAKPENSDVAS